MIESSRPAMAPNPLAEVFGFPTDNMSTLALRHRNGRLCPFHNSSGINCTKSSATDPIGVCTIFDGRKVVATCPVRFREDYKLVSDAADFFFPGKKFIALTEARLKDKNGSAAGNIDIVLAAVDDKGKIVDFGAVEVQAVYITGNVKNAFKKYMEDPSSNSAMDWPKQNYPKPDYLSSSRKRLAPQLLYKGSILHSWKKRMAVAVDENFFAELPDLPVTDKASADIAWFVYNFTKDKNNNKYALNLKEVKYTKFEETLSKITMPEIGKVDDFIAYLTDRVKKNKTMGIPASSLEEPEVEPLPNQLENNED